MIFLFQQVCIELCLLASLGHIHACALSLHHCQRAAIIAVEHIVCIADLGLVWHTGQLYLIQPVLALCPAHICEHGVDIQLAGLVLRQVEGLGHIGLLLLGSAGGEFLLQRSVFRHQRGELHLRHFLHRSGGNFAFLRQQRRVKMPFGVVLTVAIGHKIQKGIQVFQTQRRLLFGDFLAGVGGIVAHATDQVHPPPDVCAHNVPEVLGVHQTDQRVLIRHDQRFVHGIHPLHGELHRPAAVQHAGGGVDM